MNRIISMSKFDLKMSGTVVIDSCCTSATKCFIAWKCTSYFKRSLIFGLIWTFSGKQIKINFYFWVFPVEPIALTPLTWYVHTMIRFRIQHKTFHFFLNKMKSSLRNENENKMRTQDEKVLIKRAPCDNSSGKKWNKGLMRG